MAYRTLGVSIFILMVFFAAEMIGAINTEIGRINPNNRILDYNEPPRRMTNADVGFNASIPGMDGLEMFDHTETERETGDHGTMSIGRILKSTLVNSSTGFAEYMRTLFKVTDESSSSWYFISFVQWMVILNHIIALIQIILNRQLGGGL